VAVGHEGDDELSAWQGLAPWVLASASPRRADLLEQGGLSFRVHAVSIDETPLPSESPTVLCERLAREKAAAGAELFPDESILGGDTVVALGDKILGKPRDRRDAEGMLRELSGGTHQVFSSVALLAAARLGPPNSLAGVSGVAVSDVRFDDLDEFTLRTYLDGGEWEGKAGAYGIQGDGGAFAHLISGDKDTVVGLPMALVLSLADELRVLTDV
jgi:septum formation protein